MQEAEALLRSVRQRHPDLITQVIRPERMPSSSAIRMVGLQTLRALRTQTLLASKPELDLLLRLAGTRQIDQAMRQIGYKVKESNPMLLIAVGPKGQIDRLETELLKRFRFLGSEDSPTQADLDMVESAALLSAEG